MDEKRERKIEKWRECVCVLLVVETLVLVVVVVVVEASRLAG